MQQPLLEYVNAAENGNNEGISSRLDYAEIPSKFHPYASPLIYFVVLMKAPVLDHELKI